MAEANFLKIVDKIFMPGESGFGAETTWISVNVQEPSAVGGILINFGQLIFDGSRKFEDQRL